MTKINIFADSHGRNVTKKLMSRGCTDVLSVVKPGAELRNVFDESENYYTWHQWY